MAPFGTLRRFTSVETMKRTTLLQKTLPTAALFLIATGMTASAATFTAANTHDSSAGSLRQAVLDSNAAAGSAVPDMAGASRRYHTSLLKAGSATLSTGPTVVSAVSRKTHGAAGTFDVPLPLTGAVGVESRNPTSGMSHQIVVTFTGTVSVNSASVAGQSGSPMAAATASGSEVTVTLTGINNAQRLMITLNVTVDAVSGNVVIPMGILLGDTTGNGSVSSSDVSQTKSASGQVLSASNFRSDINLSGTINSSDVGAAKAQTGTALPPIPMAHTDFDYDGDGKTDYVVVRNTGGAVTWFIRYAAGGQVTVPFGVSTDFFLGGDYDGDGKTDEAVWRSGSTGTFLILQSSNGQIRTVSLGTGTNDDPRVWGDYDGDGITDPAVYRVTSTSASFIYIGSLNNPGQTQTTISLPVSSFPFPSPGDYDGDGKADACVQNGSQFVLRRSSDDVIEMISFGNGFYLVVPGDYDGDGKTDFAEVHVSGGQLLWELLYRAGGGTGGTPITFGFSSTDFTTQGDYDGDGKTDIAVWNGSTATFSIRRSSDGTVTTFPWGASGDYPVANSNTR